MSTKAGRGSYVEVAVNTTDTVVLGANPNRRSILFSNPSANPLFIAFGRTATVGQSILIPVNSQARDFDYAEYGSLLGMDVHAITTVAAGFAAMLVGEE